jgi:DNA (cytosine-5)-methyltransferase 1
MSAYYNEHDPQAAAWLRELISRGLLPAGDVDERDIQDVDARDLEPYTQCHFFAGIGGWPAALKWLAAWPDDVPVWTGSCPCQPFSGAGKGRGFQDERHLWPYLFRLIRQSRPPVFFGEQVAQRLDWLDLVSCDLEASDYAVGSADLCAASVGAPHIRQRLFFGAVDLRPIPDGWLGESYRSSAEDSVQARREVDGSGSRTFDGLADSYDARPQGREVRGNGGSERSVGQSGLAIRLAHPHGSVAELIEREGARPAKAKGVGPHSELNRCGKLASGLVGTGPIDAAWSDADWLFGKDGKWRPVESGTFPLVDGVPERVGRLRGYGNAIVPQVAATFIEAFAEAFDHALRTQ